MSLKLGRRARLHNAAIPSYHQMRSILRAGGTPMPALLANVDQASTLPASIGMMLNDQLGCCTCAGYYHAVQVWTQDAAALELTEPDACVLSLYESFGYNPSDPSTDSGCSEQTVLRYLMETGAPVSDGTRHRIGAYVELDVRNLDDVCEAIQEFGGVYIGFLVPSQWMNSGPKKVLDDDPSYDRQPDDGHCVFVVGFDRTDPANPTFRFASWGEHDWTMTAVAWRQWVDEAYAIVDPLWVEASGRTPFGLDAEALSDLSRQLQTTMPTYEAFAPPGVA